MRGILTLVIQTMLLTIRSSTVAFVIGFRATANSAFASGRPFSSRPFTPRRFPMPAASGNPKQLRISQQHLSRSNLSSLSSVSATCSADTLQHLTANAGTVHPEFDRISSTVIQEYGAHCTLFRHKKSGAEILSVSADDDNKVFGITFRTPPEDSKGVAHILEHSVLCGSKKYTSKEPFVELIKGSLNTFLNAFTYPDRTCYPIASRNLKDFYNLANVYMDAVLHPRAINDPFVHAQEGWHLELENPDDELVYKGVVYNEMKGVYSSPDSLLGRESQRVIFPDNTYGVDSGGDPRVIPDLSFEQFREFHGKYYSPTNSRIFFYGDDDVTDRLNFLDSYLCDFEMSEEEQKRLKEDSKIAWQRKRFSKPSREVHSYPSSQDGEQTHMVNVNWLMNDERVDEEESLALSVLDHLMLGTSSSILQKTLTESNLGTSVVGGGMSDELLQATFSIGLKGVANGEDVQKAEDLIHETLQKIAEEGFPEDAIAAAINTIEFSMREFNTGSFPKGLSFMLGAMSKWIYDESPVDGLRFEKPLAALKERLAKDGDQVFKDLVKKYLIENTHRVTVEMVPSKTKEQEELEEEKAKLAQIKATLSDDQVQEIITHTKELKRQQSAEDSPEDIATIPSLTLADLDATTKEYPIAVEENYEGTGVTVVRHELSSTSGIVYADAGFDISNVDYDDIPLLPLLTRVMMETGTSSMDSVQLSRKIGTHTGGIGISLSLTPVQPTGVPENQVNEGKHMQTKVFLRGKSTADKADELFGLFFDILTDANLDSQSRIVEMLKETKSGIESSIQGSGHSYANTQIKSTYDASGKIEETLGGISYLGSVKRYLDMAENDFPSLLAKLTRIRSTILSGATCRDGALINLTGDKAVLDAVEPRLKPFVGSLPDAPEREKLQDFYAVEHPWVTRAREAMESPRNVGFVVPTQVSYVGKGGRLYESGEEVTGSASVVARTLRTGYLWDHVRVIGGAYGGFCTFSPSSGIFSFLSYRDPNLETTLDTYDAAAGFLEKYAEEMTDEQLETAIIGAVGDLDGVLSPDQQGWLSMKRYLSRESPEARQKWRAEVMKTTKEDYKAFAKRLTSLQTTDAVVSSSGAFDKAREAGKVFAEVKEVF